jgi:hypothetical protein
LTAAQELGAARIAFTGRMLAGRTVALGRAHVLASPARVRVIRYLKGHGPRTVEVQTAAGRSATGGVVDAEGIEPRVGQRWRIYSDQTRQPLPTNVCGGSRSLPAGAARRRLFIASEVSFVYPRGCILHASPAPVSTTSRSRAITRLRPSYLAACGLSTDA